MVLTLNARSAFEFSEQRVPKMLASVWPRFPLTRLPVAFRDVNHGQNGHNFEPLTARLVGGRID